MASWPVVSNIERACRRLKYNLRTDGPIEQWEQAQVLYHYLSKRQQWEWGTVTSIIVEPSDRKRKQMTKAFFTRKMSLFINRMTENELTKFIRELEEDLFKECSICLSCLRHESCSQLILSCNHIYHTSCLGHLLDHNNDKCPLCRKQIIAYESRIEICSKHLSVKKFIV